jgi:hypothetical protein
MDTQTNEPRLSEEEIQQIVQTAIEHPGFYLLKSQQRGEEEPTREEKQRVLENLLRRDKALFLGTVDFSLFQLFQYFFFASFV